MTQKTLADVPVGGVVRIVRLQGEESANNQLRELGLCEGETVRVTNTAPFNDPLIVAVIDYRLSIRRDDARNILVQEC